VVAQGRVLCRRSMTQLKSAKPCLSRGSITIKGNFSVGVLLKRILFCTVPGENPDGTGVF